MSPAQTETVPITDIPEPVARRRFYRGIHNLFAHYDPLISSWVLFDNSGSETETFAYREKDAEIIILNRETFSKIKKMAGTV